MLRDRAEADVRAIVEGAADQEGDDARRIAGLYASFMDVERVEAQGVAPLRPLLDEIAAAPDRSALATVLGRRQREGRASLVSSFVSMDAKDPTRYLVHLSQSGLGLPDESYREESYGEIRAAYVTIWSASPGGRSVERAARGHRHGAGTALAAVSWDRVRNRRRETYTLMTAADLRGGRPRSTGTMARRSRRTRRAFAVVVRQPSFVEAAGALGGAPARQWQAWLAIRTVSACAVSERAFQRVSTSTAGRSRAPRRSRTGGSVASRWSRARSARRSGGSTSTGTSRRRPRSG